MFSVFFSWQQKIIIFLQKTESSSQWRTFSRIFKISRTWRYEKRYLQGIAKSVCHAYMHISGMEKNFYKK